MPHSVVRLTFALLCFCLSLSDLALVSAAEETPMPAPVPVFVSGAGGNHTYRIPAIVISQKGTLLAFCEARRNGLSDAGDIATVLRRSTDLGRTWESLRVVAEDKGHTLGNPCPVVDRDTGIIWLLLTRNLGEDREPQIEQGTSREPRTVWITHSSNDGVSWTVPENISAVARESSWTWYGTGPGNGIQLADGRLVIPSYHTPAGGRVQRSHVLVSDDHGANWKIGGIVGENTGESAVAELADGTLVMSSRPHPRATGKRAISRSSDGGATWTKPQSEAALPDPGCQGSLLRWMAPIADNDESQDSDENTARIRLLHCNVPGPKRENLTVRLSDDGGRTWPLSRVVVPGPAAYACLVQLPDGSVGCLCERGEKLAYETVSFLRFGMDWLRSP